MAGEQRLGALWGPSVDRMGAILDHSWAPIGAIMGHLGAVRGRLGAILGPSWPVLGRSWAILGLGALGGASGATVALSVRNVRIIEKQKFFQRFWPPGAPLEASWAIMAASWAILEASQEPCWAMGSHLGGYETARRAILAIVEPSGGHLGLRKRWDTTQDCAGLRRIAQDCAGLRRSRHRGQRPNASWDSF